MKGYYEVDRNILDCLFISYPCFNPTCPGKIVVSLGSLYRYTRTQCPVCKREDSFRLQHRGYLEGVHRNFEYLYIQLRELELLPLAFSTAVSPKTVFVDSTPSNSTLDVP
jgi:hypothetical protein